MLSGAMTISTRLALASFLCRALVPIGYMPATLADGGPFVMCHGGPVGAIFRELQAFGGAAGGHETPVEHAHGHTHGDPETAPVGHEESSGAPASEHKAWEHCPVGAASLPLATAGFELQALALEHALNRSEAVALVRAAALRAYESRAPPLS